MVGNGDGVGRLMVAIGCRERHETGGRDKGRSSRSGLVETRKESKKISMGHSHIGEGGTGLIRMWKKSRTARRYSGLARARKSERGSTYAGECDDDETGLGWTESKLARSG